MNEIDYQGLSDDELRAMAGKVAYELDRRRTLADTPARIAALYQRIEDAGGDTKQAEAMVTQARVAEATRVATAKTESVEIEKKEGRHEAGPTTEDS